MYLLSQLIGTLNNETGANCRTNVQVAWQSPHPGANSFMHKNGDPRRLCAGKLLIVAPLGLNHFATSTKNTLIDTETQNETLSERLKNFTTKVSVKI